MSNDSDFEIMTRLDRIEKTLNLLVCQEGDPESFERIIKEQQYKEALAAVPYNQKLLQKFLTANPGWAAERAKKSMTKV